MDYQYDYNLNLNNLTINPSGKPNTVIHPNSYNLNNLNVNSSLNSNSNISTNFTLMTNSNNTNKDYYRDDAYTKNLGSIPYSKDSEIEDLKEKLDIITNKLSAVKKERDQFQKENRELQNEIMILQSNMRQMIPGFSSNTSSSFPMINELQNRLSEFFKCDCQDIFFDLLSPELNMEGIVFFYKNAFTKIQDMIKNYFEPLINLMKKTICIDFLWTPIDNVLRKSFQSNWKMIYAQMSLEPNYYSIMQFIQSNLKLQDENPQANKIIVDFLKKTSEIFFCCYISDPQILVDLTLIGQRTAFNPVKHDSLDGFVKQKHECVCISPACYKIAVSLQENCVFKSQVLPFDYEFP